MLTARTADKRHLKKSQSIYYAQSPIQGDSPLFTTDSQYVNSFSKSFLCTPRKKRAERGKVAEERGERESHPLKIEKCKLKIANCGKYVMNRKL
jgi:hypothetical protein